MKINNETNFHWRNVLKPTPPLIFWVFTTMEAVLLAVNGAEIITKAKPGIILTLLIVQTIVGKAVLFFGKIKDEYEKEIITTVKSDTPITVETKTETLEP